MRLALAALLRIAAGREVPDAGEPDDHGHDDEAHHRVVEHRVGVERLPASLDVLLVLLEAGAALVDGAHWGVSPPLRRQALRAAGRVNPARCPSVEGSSSIQSAPAASLDQGGELTPRRTTR